jgi:flagellin
MPQIINTNISSLNAQVNLNKSQGSLHNSLERLSSGLRVNSAKDDAAGLAIATRMTANSRGMEVASRNANDGISLMQTAEGALDNIKDNLLRMRDLAVQAANGAIGSAERGQLQNEFSQLQAEVSRTITATTFNGLQILGTDMTAVSSYQIGAQTGDVLSFGSFVTSANMSAQVSAAVSSSTTLTGASPSGASAAMVAIDTALNNVTSQRSIYGAAQARFEGVVNMLATSKLNADSAISRIMDTDYAAETARMTRSQVLQQAGVAMLAQANQLPNNVMSLLR